MANAYTAMPWVIEQWLDVNAKPAAGCRLFTYAAGGSTKQTTYQSGTVSGAVAHSNPITLDSAGRPPAPVFLQPLSYKFLLAPPGVDDPPATTLWSADNITATPPFNVDLDIVGVAGETLVANEWVYLSAGDGGRTMGAWYKTDADLDYASTTARVVGIVTVGAAQGSNVTVRRLGRVTGLSGLTAGSLYYVSDTAGTITATAPANTRRVGQADGTTTFVIAAEIEEPLKGYLPLDLSLGRVLAAGAIPDTTANGGFLSSNTAPIFQRVNGATDQALRINWAATVVTEVTWCFSYPPDWDGLNNATVHLLAAMGGASNTPVVGVAYFEGVGDTNAGGNTAAITGTTVAEYTVTITAANVGEHPNFAAVSLTPAAHGTDALFLYAIWIEYTRKLKST
jgi:hypothetical protein